MLGSFGSVLDFWFDSVFLDFGKRLGLRNANLPKYPHSFTVITITVLPLITMYAENLWFQGK